MKLLKFLPIITLSIGTLLLSSLSSCTAGGAEDVAPGLDEVKNEKGVSKMLASARKAAIEVDGYSLYINMPTKSEKDILGKVTVRFKMIRDDGVLPPLDFKAPAASVRKVSRSGGEEVNYIFEEEHIIICDNNYSTSDTLSYDIEFVVPKQPLNLREDMLYSLLVPDRARTLFPCFDQPDLKVSIQMNALVPNDWEAVSNTDIAEVVPQGECKLVRFAPSRLISTYLISLTAGRFEKKTMSRNGREITMYYRETDPQKLAQIPSIFDEVFESIEWMEDYTGTPYPWEKYDFIVLPGFQFGGMEHVGATLFNDRKIFLSKGYGVKEQMDRYQLIAHEVAHMWFGDYVTMKWFDEVWTKEVMANYMATQVIIEKFPEVEQDINLCSYAMASYSEDRTKGSNSINQELDNLQNAGLVYGNIIYNKSPLVMNMLALKIGKEALREGLQEYLNEYRYENASWDNLITILDSKTDENLKKWSDAWVNEKGMPTIECKVQKGGRELVLSQKDPWGRGILWGQNITARVVFADGSEEDVSLSLQRKSVKYVAPAGSVIAEAVPNVDARGYGYFKSSGYTAKNPHPEWNDVARYSTLINLYENYLHNNCPDAPEQLLVYLKREKNELLFSTAVRYLATMNLLHPVDGFDKVLFEIISDAEGYNESCRRSAFKTLIAGMSDTAIVASFYKIFIAPQGFEPFDLTEQDLTSLSYELSVRMPESSHHIIATQRKRITNKDRLEGFDFISRAVVGEENDLDALFSSLLLPENRRIEPRAQTALSYLNHPVREERSRKYIRQGLEVLEEVQATGDIFFPKNWISALLSAHQDAETDEIIAQFFASRPDYSPMLRNKILQTRLTDLPE